MLTTARKSAKIVVAAVLFAASTAFGIQSVGCGGDTSGEREGTPSEYVAEIKDNKRELDSVVIVARPKETPLWAPDLAVALIPDIGGHFRDCACSGSSIGGLERVPFASNDALSLRYLFYGDTIFPAQGRDKANEPYKRILAEAASDLFAGLGSVTWEVSPTDFDQMQTSGGQVSGVEATFSVSVEGVTLKIETGDNTFRVIIGSDSFPVVAPQRRASGRHMAFVCVWKSDNTEVTDKPWVFSRIAGALAPLRPEKGSASFDMLAKELKRARFVVTAWTTSLPERMPQDARIGKLIDQYESRVSHGDVRVVVEDGTFRARLKESVETCQSCHPKATAAWLASRHSSAYITLQARNRQRLRVCLACHVEQPDAKFEPSADGFVYRKFAVSCLTCHSEPGRRPDSSTCIKCHTAHTDPGGHYLAHVKTICSGDTVKKSKEHACLRR